MKDAQDSDVTIDDPVGQEIGGVLDVKLKDAVDAVGNVPEKWLLDQPRRAVYDALQHTAGLGLAVGAFMTGGN
jgi:hypothetical protein